MFDYRLIYLLFHRLIIIIHIIQMYVLIHRLSLIYLLILFYFIQISEAKPEAADWYKNLCSESEISGIDTSSASSEEAEELSIPEISLSLPRSLNHSECDCHGDTVEVVGQPVVQDVACCDDCCFQKIAGFDIDALHKTIMRYYNCTIIIVLKQYFSLPSRTTQLQTFVSTSVFS